MGKEYETWQIEQANEALKLYNYFLTQQKRTFSPDKQAWHYLKEEVRRLMRLKHLFYRTEKLTFPGLQDSKNFALAKHLTNFPHHLKDFLTLI